ncbi:MAG: tRNA dimethylallyltransferase [Candidatus Moranbacteria bacterium]|nr:tRNA dimethylallyltransferase [Candidatus Moranbacteria bacterium]
MIINKKQITIIGPTASGKSDIAIALAKKFKGEVISSDSRQIYRGMDIGSGKESGKLETIYYTKNGSFKIVKNKNVKVKNFQPENYKSYICENIPHYMIDIVHPNTIYNVEKFVRKVKKIREEIWQRENLPMICGGTMFWSQALVEKQQFPKVLPNEKLRQDLSKKSKEEIFNILKKLDSDRAEDIKNKNEQNNIPRLVRAIEIATALGKVPKIKKEIRQNENNLIISVTHPKEFLHKKIEKRMDKWFDEGIFEEIKKLHHEMNVPWNRLESFGLEYKWCTRYVRNQIDFDEMRENTIRDLKRYAKRQMTWIRRWEKSGAEIHHVTSVKEAEKLVGDFLK